MSQAFRKSAGSSGLSVREQSDSCAVPVSEDKHGASSTDASESNESLRNGAQGASSGNMQHRELGGSNWRIGAGNQDRVKEAKNIDDAYTTLLVGQQSGRSILYPLLEAFKLRCPNWSSCIARMRKAWAQNSTISCSNGISSGSKCPKGEWRQREEITSLGKDVSTPRMAFRKPAICNRPPVQHSKYPRLNNSPLKPAMCNKLVYFIRHGTAFCNIGRCSDWKVDQRLTSYGWDQTALLRAHLAKIKSPQVVFVSTLARALETCAGAFGYLSKTSSAAEKHEELDPANNWLMKPQTDLIHHQCAHPGICSTPNTPPLIAIEACRERLGDGVVPNQRQLASCARLQFPGINFSLVESEEDIMYSRFDHPGGESFKEISRRGKAFLNFLRSRPEECIGVVSHGHFLNYTLNQKDEKWQEYWNAELRAYQLSDTACTPARQDLWFKP